MKEAVLSPRQTRVRPESRRLIFPLVLAVMIVGIWCWSYCFVERYVLAGYGGQVNEIVLVEGVMMAGVSRESIDPQDAFTVRRFAERLTAESLVTSVRPLASYVPSYITSYDNQFLAVPGKFGVETQAWIPLGIVSNPLDEGGRVKSAGVLFPIWFLLVPVGVRVLFILRRIIRQRRALSEGHCTQCGYDLRASLDRCPECGLRFPIRTAEGST